MLCGKASVFTLPNDLDKPVCDMVAFVQLAPEGMAFAGKSASQKYHGWFIALPILTNHGSMSCIKTAYGVKK